MGVGNISWELGLGNWCVFIVAFFASKIRLGQKKGGISSSYICTCGNFWLLLLVPVTTHHDLTLTLREVRWGGEVE